MAQIDLPVYIARTKEGWRLAVWAQPGAKKTELAGLYGDFLKIRLQAPAVDNKANTALMKFVAKLFQLRPGQVSLESGHTARQKNLLLQTKEEPDWTVVSFQA